MACVGAHLITAHADLNDLTVVCNHLSRRQLISYRPTMMSDHLKFLKSRHNLCQGWGDGGVEGKKCLRDKYDLVLKETTIIKKR